MANPPHLRFHLGVQQAALIGAGKQTHVGTNHFAPCFNMQKVQPLSNPVNINAGPPAQRV